MERESRNHKPVSFRPFVKWRIAPRARVAFSSNPHTFGQFGDYCIDELFVIELYKIS